MKKLEKNKNIKLEKKNNNNKNGIIVKKNEVKLEKNLIFFFNNFKDFILKKKFDIIAVFFLLIFYFSLEISVVSPLNQPPSPMYGGDYFYQLGCTNNIKYGGDMFKNCNLISNNPGYFPIYGILAGKVASIFDLSAFDAEIVVSYFSYLLSVIFSYLLFKLISRSILIASLGVLFFEGIRPILKYTDFGTYVITPILILSAYLFYKKQDWIRSIFFGISLGIASITHSVLFPAGYLYMGFVVVYLLNGKIISSFDFTKFLGRLKVISPKIVLFFIIAFSISLLYWFGPLFISHGHTSPHYLEWNGPGDMNNFGLQIHIFYIIIKMAFFNFNSFVSSILSVIMIIALILIFIIKKGDEEYEFARFSYILMFIITFSYFLTMPIFGIQFVPNYIYYVFGSIIKILFIVASLMVIRKILELNFKFNKKYFNIIIIILILISVYSYNLKVDNYKENQWYKVGLNKQDDYRNSLENFVINNTNINDVFLTTKENGFVLNGITGRKLVAGRRAQNDAFENMDIREMDLAIILYGNNTQVKKKLLKKYNVKYLYWDYYWIQSEYTFDQKERIKSWFDPLIAFYNDSIINLLNKNGVNYFIENTYVDPALKTKYHPKFDLIFISPENYNNATNPWNPNLNSMLEEVWDYNTHGQKIAAIYKVNYNYSS